MDDAFHMSPDEFRRRGREVVDWVADYMERVGDLPIRSTVEPGDIERQLPLVAPDAPESFDALLADLDDVVLPGITHWQSPGWFGYFPANVSGPSILAELASAGIGAQGMLWATSPALTEVESRVLDWLVELLGLPDSWKTSVGPGGGVIQMSASDSTHLMHVVAREARDRAGSRDGSTRRLRVLPGSLVRRTRRARRGLPARPTSWTSMRTTRCAPMRWRRRSPRIERPA